MADSTFRSLRYGYPGQAAYDPQSLEWRFIRKVMNSWRMKTLGDPSLPILPSIQIVQPTRSNTESLKAQDQRMVRKYPEIAPGALYAHFESKISEIISVETSYLDPNRAELLDFGHAGLPKSSETVNVAAIAGGPAGDLLRLLPMKAVSHGWDTVRNRWIESLEPHSADVGWWTGVGQPIQQIRFAHLPYEQLTFLAVRTIETISIFAPVRHLSAIAPKTRYPGQDDLAASRFDPNHLFTLSAEQLKQSPPADVSFNPWQQRQVGVVNQRGFWSIWQFQRRNSNPNAIKVREPELIQSDQMPKTFAKGDDSGDDFEDGWHSMMWITNVNTVMICSRNALVVYDVPSKQLSKETSKLGISETGGWILDICRHPVFEDHVFVTTTSEIHWLSVLENPRTNDNQAKKGRIKVQLSWAHFRDPKDTSLRTTVIRGGDDDHGESLHTTSF